MDEELLKFAICYGPLILFLVIVLFSFLFGCLFGLRRSKIFLIHSAIAAVICVSLYYFLVNNNSTDSFLLSLVNFFCKTFTGSTLPDKLNVSGDFATLSDVLIAYLPNAMNLSDSIKVLINENIEYLLGLVNLIYHLVFFIVIYALYLVLKLLMFIIYLIFYSNLKYKRRNKYEVYLNNTDELYRPKRLWGGLIGFIRGLIRGICVISLIGTCFFVINGGTSSQELSSINTENTTLNEGMTVYKYIEKYGNEGFIGTLNSFHDAEGNPYYLSISDFVLQGNYVDNDENSRTMYLRNELATYVNLAKRTVNLLNKYDPDDVSKMLDGTSQINLSEIIGKLMSNESFGTELKSLIMNFDNNSYVLNFGLNIVSSMINNLDSMEFASSINDDVKEILQILFRKGYFAPSINSEQAIEEEDSSIVLPYLNFSNILTKEDLCNVYDLVVDIIQAENKDAISIVKLAMPYVTSLSIFGSEKSSEVSPVLGRMYEYAADKFLNDSENPTTYSLDLYSEKLYDINWVDEINYLAACSNDIFTLYDNVYVNAKDEEGNVNILNVLFDVFDKDNDNYEENVTCYDDIVNTLGKSHLLGEVLQTNKVYTMLVDSIRNASSTFDMPSDIVYTNTYDSDGNLVSYGEISNLLTGFKAIASNEQLSSSIKKLMNGEEVQMLDLLEDNIDEFKAKGSDGYSIFDHLINSDILESLISSLLIKATENEVIYIPSNVLLVDSNGNRVNIIQKSELNTIFNNLPKLLEMIDKAKSGNDGLDEVIFNTDYDELFHSNIVQGTVGKLIVQKLADNETIIIPVSLKEPEAWCSTSTSDGELLAIVNFLRKSNLKISVLTEDSSSAIDQILDLSEDEENVKLMLKSKIIYYTISNKIENGLSYSDFTLIVPTSSKTKLVNDSISYLINEDEITSLFNMIQVLGINDLDKMQTEDLLRNIEKNREKVVNSNILKASISYYLVTSDVSSVIDIPTSLDSSHDGSKESLQELSTTNGWNKELNYLLISLEELFDVSTNEDFKLEDEYLDARFKELINGGLLETSSYDASRSVIEVCYDSSVISYTLTKTVDKYIPSTLLNNNEIRLYSKSGSIYKITEVKALLVSIQKLGVDIDTLESYDFIKHLNELITPISGDANNYCKLDYLYESYLIAGIMSEEIADVINSSSYLVNYDKAYRSDIEIYKKSEIKALIKLLGDQELSSSFSVNNISLSKLLDAAYTNDGEVITTNSYLVVAAISINVSSVDSIVVPSYCVELTLSNGQKILRASDIYALFKALNAIGIETIDNIDINNLNITSSSNDSISDSSIMRATIAKQIKITSNGSEMTLFVENNSDYAFKSTDIKDNAILILTKQEMKNIITGLLELSDDDKVNLSSSLTIETLIALNNKEGALETLLASSVLHIAVSKIIENYRASNISLQAVTSAPSTSIDIIYFKSLQIDTLKIYTTSEIITTVDKISNIIGG